MSDKATVFTGHGITMFQLTVIRARLGLEMKGLKGRGQTMYSLCKERFGFKGNRGAVYMQVCDLIESMSKKLKDGDVTQS